MLGHSKTVKAIWTWVTGQSPILGIFRVANLLSFIHCCLIIKTTTHATIPVKDFSGTSGIICPLACQIRKYEHETFIWD